VPACTHVPQSMVHLAVDGWRTSLCSLQRSAAFRVRSDPRPSPCCCSDNCFDAAVQMATFISFCWCSRTTRRAWQRQSRYAALCFSRIVACDSSSGQEGSRLLCLVIWFVNGDRHGAELLCMVVCADSAAST
jgi:hypothetical protein